EIVCCLERGPQAATVGRCAGRVGGGREVLVHGGRNGEGGRGERLPAAAPHRHHNGDDQGRGNEDSEPLLPAESAQVELDLGYPLTCSSPLTIGAGRCPGGR